MFLGLAAAQGDVLSRMPEIMPAAIKGKRPEYDVCTEAGDLSDAHLRAMEAAQNNVENVSGSKVIQILIEKLFELVRLFAPQLGLLAFHLLATAKVGCGRDCVYRDTPLVTHVLER